jgi:hypothetical protein
MHVGYERRQLGNRNHVVAYIGGNDLRRKLNQEFIARTERSLCHFFLLSESSDET